MGGLGMGWMSVVVCIRCPFGSRRDQRKLFLASPFARSLDNMANPITSLADMKSRIVDWIDECAAHVERGDEIRKGVAKALTGYLGAIKDSVEECEDAIHRHGEQFQKKLDHVNELKEEWDGRTLDLDERRLELLRVVRGTKRSLPDDRSRSPSPAVSRMRRADGGGSDGESDCTDVGMGKGSGIARSVPGDASSSTLARSPLHLRCLLLLLLLLLLSLLLLLLANPRSFLLIHSLS